MKIQPHQLAQIAVKNSTDHVEARRQSGAFGNVSGNSFQETLRTMRQSVDLAMADRFLTVSTQWDKENKSDGPFGGMSASQLGMSMLSSLSALGLPSPAPNISAVRNAYGLPTEPGVNAGVPQSGMQAGLSGDQSQPGSNLANRVLGLLSRRFESGSQGSEAIGYDRVGGTSYGIYQLSSRQGSLNEFLDFVATRAPEIAQRLQNAGPANTGSKEGGLPEAWKSVARDNPELFGQLQSSFIELSHYQPAVQAVAQATGLDMNNLPQALNEVLFSTAVQHGPRGAANIFQQALNGLGGLDGLDGLSLQSLGLGSLGQEGRDQNGGLDLGSLGQLIENIYSNRATRFGSSTPEVQAAVGNRMRNEKSLALAMLSGADFSELS